MTIELRKIYDPSAARDALLEGLRPLMGHVYSGCDKQERALREQSTRGPAAPFIGSGNTMSGSHILADTNPERHNTDTEANQGQGLLAKLIWNVYQPRCSRVLNTSKTCVMGPCGFVRVFFLYV